MNGAELVPSIPWVGVVLALTAAIVLGAGVQIAREFLRV